MAIYVYIMSYFFLLKTTFRYCNTFIRLAYNIYFFCILDQFFPLKRKFLEGSILIIFESLD